MTFEEHWNKVLSGNPEIPIFARSLAEAAWAAATAGLDAKQARPLADWHEAVGVVLWWRCPVDEPPYCGSPVCDDWPEYHTHWTPLIVPYDPE